MPPAFEIIPKLLLLLDDPETDSDALAELVHVDPGLTADVLHVSNSSFYSRGARTETLVEAVNRVGLREIYRIAMKIITSPVLAGPQNPGGAQVDVWKHSLTTAVAAQVLAVHADDAEVAFTAALLHDIGKVVIGQALGKAYQEVIDTCKLEHRALFIAEQRIFKITHAEVGAKLLRRWFFPERIIAAVETHHDPRKAPRAHARLAGLVYAANILARRIGAADGFPEYVVDPELDCLRLANLDANALEEHQEEVKQCLEREEMRFQS